MCTSCDATCARCLNGDTCTECKLTHYNSGGDTGELVCKEINTCVNGTTLCSQRDQQCQCDAELTDQSKLCGSDNSGSENMQCTVDGSIFTLERAACNPENSSIVGENNDIYDVN